ncbi:O-fucosyltransferase 8 isoform X2 [Impatiens glandulifera]|nr:O-fucosyltransferase 8 isoform X2 [Impatiens glandulifera]XP_047310612.1 O-fucosyltransferase 8 isoform X2 [Impatiens glandulifera]
MYNRLHGLASIALEEKELAGDPLDLWEEPYPQASRWKPCVDMTTSKDTRKPKESSNGFILVSANGGLNQQRVAVCNAVAVTALLNATLVIPKFLFSNVWKDPSQFGDIYQEQHFINILKNEVNIVKELPPHLKSLDFEAIGSLVTDADLVKEAKPGLYIDRVLPILKRNGVVHLLGFANRLGFDPLPFELQRLRCKCNFHSLKFVPKIQQLGTLLIRRIRKHNSARNALDKKLLGKFISNTTSQEEAAEDPSKYLALHLRFEIDMISYSMCEFGGGEKERKELQAYRNSHFPLLNQRLKKSNYVPSSKELRKLGKCPLTPEEAALVLAGIGFKRRTFIYLAGSRIYGGESRMNPLTSLYPNMVTKEDLLTPTELAPFRNFSSQMAALDFMACATADVFAITDSGSQLSSLVSGLRKYYGGGGRAPILRPDKRRLAEILAKNGTISWRGFEDRIRKMMTDDGRRERFFGESIYREPRCQECMCKKK